MGSDSMNKHPTFTIPWVNATFELRWLSLCLLVVQGTVLVLAMRVSRTTGDGPLYLSSTAVVTAEVIKIVTCLGILLVQRQFQVKTLAKELKSELLNFDTVKVSVPGLLYLVQNNLLFVAVSNLEAAVYQVTYQLKILTTAFFTVTMLHRTIAKHQVLSLFMLAGGVSMVQLAQRGGTPDKAEGDSNVQNPTLGLICVLCACMSSGFAGVYFEKILKAGRQVSLWIRNVQLGLFGTMLGLIGIFSSGDYEKIQQDGFFQGYTPLVWFVVVLQAAGGLMIAVVIKYADNILKGYATSVSIILSALISSMFLGFKVTTMFFVGTLLVIAAVILYGMKAPCASVATITYDKVSPVAQDKV